MCDNGIAICKYCPNFLNPNNNQLEYLHWRKGANVCDYPQVAGCTL